jgi:aryl-alcohol dehydrogenase-like predicted oxidoreductase
VVSAPIVGVTKPGHLQDALDSLAVELDLSEVQYLEEAYTPHQIAGFA